MSHIKSVIFVSSIFLFFQAIDNTQIGILSQFASQNGNQWVGPYANALLFLGSAILAPINFYIDKYPYNRILFISSLSFIGYIGMAILFLQVGFSTVVEILILIVSLICGLILSALYNGQFNYINTCSKLDKQPSKYFGINLAIVQSANILGNVVSAILITPLGQKTYTIVMTIVMFIICCAFLLVKNVKYEKQNIELTQEKYEQNKQQSVQQRQNKQIIKNSSPYSLLFCYGLSGIALSFVYTSFSVMMYRTFDEKDPINLNRLTFIIFIYEGIGQLIGGVTIALFSQKIKSLKKCYSLISCIFIFSLAILYLGFEQKNVYLISFAMLLAGIGDSTLFSIGLSISGIWNQKGISAFTLNQCSFFAIGNIIFYYGGFQLYLIIGVFIHAIAIASLSFNKVIK